ncbi:3-oxoacyl-ACP reductase FabG [Piscinibacter koreensis]|uniref:3-oxoacyl-ACP reductase FabG n=1 Tax=Piscinibacter koreensis TaxID=2742824 RepID=A0A7Y6NMT1_9BURK|nr:3-oxoacyl-ACP reductase FabG [Schlegelella koreensis]
MSPPPSRTALVTGAASGIGLAIARRLLRQGHRVLMVDRASTLAPAADALNAELDTLRAHAVGADLASAEGIAELVARVDAEHGGVDMLVNNAGTSRGRAGFDLDATTLDDWNTVIGVNLTAPFLLCKAVVPAMRGRGWGRIVNIASRAGRTGAITGGLQYAASKAGLIGMTRALALQCAPHAITANCVAPGWVETPMTSRVPPAAAAAALKSIPLGRAAQPDEIAAIVAFLCSDDGGYITGAVVDANGGSFMG